MSEVPFSVRVGDWAWEDLVGDVIAAARRVDEIVEASPVVTSSLAGIARYEAAQNLRAALAHLDSYERIRR